MLQTTGPRVAPATSLALKDMPADALDMIAADNDEAWRLRMPRLPVAINGASDLIGALFFFHWLKRRLGRRRARRGRIVCLWRRLHDRRGACANSGWRKRRANSSIQRGASGRRQFRDQSLALGSGAKKVRTRATADGRRQEPDGPHCPRPDDQSSSPELRAQPRMREKHVSCSVQLPSEMCRSARIRMHALQQAIIRRANVLRGRP